MTKLKHILLLAVVLLNSQQCLLKSQSANYHSYSNSFVDSLKLDNAFKLIKYYALHQKHDSSLIIISELKDEFPEVFENYKLLYKLGTSIEKQDDRISKPYYLKAMYGALNNRDSLYIALTKLRIGSSDSLKNHYEESSKLIFEALTYLEKENYIQELDEAYFETGSIYLKIKETKKAKYYFLKADSIAKLTNDLEVRAYIANNIANTLYFEDSLDQCLAYYERTLNYLKNQNIQKELALLENNISIVLSELGRNKESLAHAKSALAARIALKDTSGIASSSLNIAFYYNQDEKYDSAIYYIVQAIDFAKLKKREDVLNMSYKAASSVYQSKGEYKNALLYYKLHKSLNDSIYKNERLQMVQNYEKEKDIEITQIKNKFLIEAYQNKIHRNAILITALILLLTLFGIILFIVYRSNLIKKKFNNEIFKNLKFLEALIETVPDPIFYRNNEEKFIGCNRAFCDLVGKQKGQIIGKTQEQVYDRLSLLDFVQNDKEVYESGELVQFNKSYLDEEGNEVHLQFRNAPYFISRDSSRGIIGLIIDMTKQKETEKKLIEANESKELFLSIISHDIRNAFNVVLAFTSLLNEDYNYYKDDKRIELIRNIHEASNNTFLLLENLLGWSRAQQGGITIRRHFTDVADLLDESIALLTPASKEKNITIDNQVDSIELNIDENSIKTVFRNLISNAIKYTYNSGYIKISLETERDCAIFHFEDNGIGMEENTLANLFELNKDKQKLGTNNESGSGLGLLLSKELIELNDGSIFVQSELGKGSRFSVKLHNL